MDDWPRCDNKECTFYDKKWENHCTEHPDDDDIAVLCCKYEAPRPDDSLGSAVAPGYKPETRHKREIIADVVLKYMYVPMLKDDDEEWKLSRALFIADEIESATGL